MTELANLTGENEPLVKYDDKQLDKVMKSSDYLPRLQVMTGNNDLVKAGSIPIGKLALIFTKDRFVNLGDAIDVKSISVRPKALRMSNPPVAIYDQGNPEFAKIEAESFLKDSGCSFGPEFLIYIPDHGLATFHMGSKSARREAPTLASIMRPDGDWKPMDATIGVKFIPKSPTNQYSWHAPQIKECTTPVVIPEDYLEELREQLKKFNNPPAQRIESVEEEQRPR